MRPAIAKKKLRYHQEVAHTSSQEIGTSLLASLCPLSIDLQQPRLDVDQTPIMANYPTKPGTAAEKPHHRQQIT